MTQLSNDHYTAHWTDTGKHCFVKEPLQNAPLCSEKSTKGEYGTAAQMPILQVNKCSVCLTIGKQERLIDWNKRYKTGFQEMLVGINRNNE